MPEDLVNPAIDQQSVMTYISQFPEAQLKEGAPFTQTGHPIMVKVTGQGVEKDGPIVHTETQFTVDTTNAGYGPLRVTITGPDEDDVQPSISHEDGIYTYKYTPSQKGEHAISVKWCGEPVPGSPYMVHVAKLPYKVSGPGVSGDDLHATAPAELWVDALRPGTKPLIKVSGPKGQLPSSYITTEDEEEEKRCTAFYVPPVPGQYKIDVLVGGKHIGDSPYTVDVENRKEESKCCAKGPGVEGRNIDVGKRTWFKVFTTGIPGHDKVNTTITSPAGVVPTQKSRIADAITKYTYTPTHNGEHNIVIKVGPKESESLLKFKVMVPSEGTDSLGIDPNALIVTGSGVSGKGACAGKIASVFIDTTEVGPVPVEAMVTPPGADDEQVIELTPMEDNPAILQGEYLPEEPGYYDVQVNVASNPAKGFQVPIANPEKVKLSSSSLIFTNPGDTHVVDCYTENAGPGQLSVDCGSTPLKVEVKPVEEDHYQLLFTAPKEGSYTANVCYNGVPVSNPIQLMTADPSKCKVSGPGINSKVVANKETHFVVDNSAAGPGEVDTTILSPSGKEVDSCVSKIRGSQHKITYIPDEAGDHRIDIQFANYNLPDSPYKVHVTDPTAVVCTTDPEKRSKPGETIKVIVDASKAGNGDLSLSLEGPEECTLLYDDKSKGSQPRFTFAPSLPGVYKITATLDGLSNSSEPHSVTVCDISKVAVSGSGITGKGAQLGMGIQLGRPADVLVDTSESGPGELEATLRSPTGEIENLLLSVEDEDCPEVFVGHYTPTSPGNYSVDISFDKQVVPESPFQVRVISPDDVAIVPGDAIINEECPIDFFLKDVDSEEVVVSFTGPNGEKFPLDYTCFNMEDSRHCQIKFTPEKAGTIQATFYYSETLIKEKVPIQVVDPFQCRVYGPGVEEKQVVGKETYLKIDTTKAGDGSLMVIPCGSDETPLKTKLTEEQRGVYVVKYTPEEAGELNVRVLYSEREVPNSPFSVSVTDPSMCRVYGPGVEEKQVAGEETHIMVDTTKAGDGLLMVNPCGVDQVPLKYTLKEEERGIFVIKYTPKDAGEMTVNVLLDEQDVPNSPFSVLVVDPTACQVYGPGVEKKLVASEETFFTVDTTEAGDGSLAVITCGPDEKALETDVTEEQKGVYKAKYTPKDAGETKITVLFSDRDVPGSPFTVSVIDPSVCRVYGPGVEEKQIAGEETHVMVDTTKAGDGLLMVNPCGADQVPLKYTLKEEERGVFVIKYTPKDAGEMTVNVLLDQQDVPNSPFSVLVVDPTACQVYGPGVEKKQVANEETFFTVDTTEAGDGSLAVITCGPDEKALETDVTEEQKGVYKVKYTPKDARETKITILFSDRDVPGSPFLVPVIDPSMCRVYGPGVEEKQVAGKETHFSIDSTQSGEGQVTVAVCTSDNTPLETCTTEDEPGVQRIAYTPPEGGKVTVDVQFDDEAVPKSPFSVQVIDPASIMTQLTCPSVIPLGDSVTFAVDTSRAGNGDLNVYAEGPEECTTACNKRKKGIYDFSFTPETPGDYTVQAKFDNYPTKSDPLVIKVLNLSQASVTTPDIPLLMGQEASFDVDVSAVGVADLSSTVETADGSKIEPVLSSLKPEESYALKFTPMCAGPCTFTLLYAGKNIGESPYSLPVIDPSSVIVSGLGNACGVVNEDVIFQVDATAAGEGGEMRVVSEGPSRSEAFVENDEEEEGKYIGSVTADYPGEYQVHVLYSDVEVPGSPFLCPFKRPPPDASEVQMEPVTKPGQFAVDARNAGGAGQLEVFCTDSYNPPEFVSVKHNNDYTFTVDFAIKESAKLHVKWHGEHVPGSPFSINPETQ